MKSYKKLLKKLLDQAEKDEESRRGKREENRSKLRQLQQQRNNIMSCDSSAAGDGCNAAQEEDLAGQRIPSVFE